jgi:hypothetical protein
MRDGSVLPNLIATSRGCRRLREIYGQILPRFSASQSARCANEGRRHEFGGRSQFRTVSLRHAANIAVLEGASTGPLDHFTDGLLLGRGDSPCRCQELVAKLVEA